MSRFDWMDDALCRQVDPELFHPTIDANHSKAAKRVCRECQVTSECLSWGLENPDMIGILGGTTEKERRRLRSQTERRTA